ncbi:hypothetical protein PSTT_13246 [Puccinia striiformis]|uniref:Uncharacterized protein n=1 Tax=Puccinia striiformis TaxID=27350 RepID=A0A2S4USQ9_9BASI|nr:hypothetical protein PSTT_13246 [Puccinia striiformis]
MERCSTTSQGVVSDSRFCLSNQKLQHPDSLTVAINAYPNCVDRCTRDSGPNRPRRDDVGGSPEASSSSIQCRRTRDPYWPHATHTRSVKTSDTRNAKDDNEAIWSEFDILTIDESTPYPDFAQVIIDEGIKVCETAGGPSAAPIIQMLRKADIYVIHKCTSVRHANSAVKIGANMLSIDGFECAGHPGEDDIGGVVLLARAAQELKVPFIASGGFANGRGLAGAIALGAAGVNMGTAFMNTARVYKNEVAMEVVKMESRPGGCEFKDIAHLVSGARGKKVYDEGDVNAGIWTCGISVGLLTKIQSCESFISECERDAEEIILGMGRMIDQQSSPRSKL